MYLSPSCWCFRNPFFSSLASMTRTDESPGGSVSRARISSGGARLPSEKTAFIISRSRRVSLSVLDFGIFQSRRIDPSHATLVASYARQMSHVKPLPAENFIAPAPLLRLPPSLPNAREYETEEWV